LDHGRYKSFLRGGGRESKKENKLAGNLVSTTTRK